MYLTSNACMQMTMMRAKPFPSHAPWTLAFAVVVTGLLFFVVVWFAVRYFVVQSGEKQSHEARDEARYEAWTIRARLVEKRARRAIHKAICAFICQQYLPASVVSCTRCTAIKRLNSSTGGSRLERAPPHHPCTCPRHRKHSYKSSGRLNRTSADERAVACRNSSTEDRQVRAALSRLTTLLQALSTTQ